MSSTEAFKDTEVLSLTPPSNNNKPEEISITRTAHQDQQGEANKNEDDDRFTVTPSDLGVETRSSSHDPDSTRHEDTSAQPSLTTKSSYDEKRSLRLQARREARKARPSAPSSTTINSSRDEKRNQRRQAREEARQLKGQGLMVLTDPDEEEEKEEISIGENLMNQRVSRFREEDLMDL